MLGSADRTRAGQAPLRAAFLAASGLVAVGMLAVGVESGRFVLGVDAAGCVVAAAAVLAGVVSWRFMLYALLLYLPVSGIPILATTSHTGPAVLLKDFVFVLPAYLGFLIELVRGRLRLPLAAIPMALVTMLALLVCLQALNPALPDRLVGAIGIKVWLFYIPLAFLGYHLVRGVGDLRRLLMLLSVSALLPALIGIVEAALFRSGHAPSVYRFYGSAAAVATGLFTELRLPSGGVLHRVPSTFSSWTQYFAYVLSMVPITYAWWRIGHRGGRALAAAAVWFVVVVATLSSGARVAFLVVPLVLGITIVLEHVGGGATPVRLRSARVLAPVGLVLLAAAVLAVSIGGLLGNLVPKARVEFTHTFLHRMHQAIEVTWLGLGSGIDTIASRYAVPPERLFAAFGGVWYESWFVKVVLELGVPGLVLVVVLFAAILWRGVRRHVVLRDPRLKTVSAALIAFLFVNVLLALSKPYLDNDPINVYFWLFAGILARVAVLDARAADG